MLFRSVVVPVFTFSPIIILGYEPQLFGTLALAYLLGCILEDYVYFLVNPHFGRGGWNSRTATWMPWFKIGRYEVPQMYVRNFVAAAVVWAVFFR